MRAKKVDANQKQIVEELRGLGIDVFVASDFGNGFPDLVIPYAGFNWFVEIKTKTGTLTRDQRKFKEKWTQGQYSVCRSTAEVLEQIGAESQIELLATSTRNAGV